MIKLRSFVTHAIGFGFSTICKKREQKTGKSKGISVNVYNSNGAKVTNNWNWLNYLGFDKKGYSYELTKKEYYYLEAANKRMSLEDIKAFGVTFDEASKVFEGFIKGGH